MIVGHVSRREADRYESYKQLTACLKQTSTPLQRTGTCAW